jgi:hypothetical protein
MKNSKKSEETSKKDFILIQVPTDFDSRTLNGHQLDLNSTEFVDIPQAEENSLGMNYLLKREGEEAEDQLKEQLMIFYPKKEKNQYAPISKNSNKYELSFLLFSLFFFLGKIIKRKYKIIKSFNPMTKIRSSSIIRTKFV